MLADWAQALNPHFLLLALLAGSGIALIAGPLGTIMVWRRLSNFGDTLAHSALLGIALSFLFQLPFYVGLFGLSLLLALFLGLFKKPNYLGNDTLLVILTHASLALGLMLSSYLQHQGMRLDLLSYLYGDILSVTLSDLLLILGIDVLGFIGLYFLWQPTLSLTLHEDLAKMDGINSHRTQLGVFLIMALTFSVSVKLLGVLLLTALFIIPAATARYLARSPEQMGYFASLLGIASVVSGVFLSEYWDLPTGPMIVLSTSILFFVISRPKIGRPIT